MHIAVTGLGVVSPLGVGVAPFLAALDAGRVAIAGDGDGGLAARVGDFGAKQVIAPGSLRRLPRLSQMVIVAAKEALAAAALPYDAARVGVVVGTGLGTLHETVEFMRGYLEGGPENASPALFPSSVMNAAAGQLALECRLQGANSTVNHRDASALGAVAMGMDLLALGRADALVVCAGDELDAAAAHAYRRLAVVSAGAVRPYDEARDGLAPGEGACALVLERADAAHGRGARVHALLVGRGESGDDRPRLGWGRAGDAPAPWPAALAAVRAAVAGEPVSWVAGGGHGGAYDARELDTLATALGALPPTSSLLGQSGESASAAMLRLVAAIHALEAQRLPGTVGLERPIARHAAALVMAPRAAAVERVLVPAFAQGGANVALVLARAPA